LGGGEVSSALREDPATNRIPTIYLTALFTKSHEVKYGSSQTLAKPIEMPKLIATIESCLSTAATL